MPHRDSNTGQHSTSVIPESTYSSTTVMFKVKRWFSIRRLESCSYKVTNTYILGCLLHQSINDYQCHDNVTLRGSAGFTLLGVPSQDRSAPPPSFLLFYGQYYSNSSKLWETLQMVERNISPSLTWPDISEPDWLKCQD